MGHLLYSIFVIYLILPNFLNRDNLLKYNDIIDFFRNMPTWVYFCIEDTHLFMDERLVFLNDPTQTKRIQSKASFRA